MLCVLLLACVAVVLAAIPLVVKLVVIVLLSVKIYAQLRCMRNYQQPALRCGVRHNSTGWQLWSPKQGWRSVQLRTDSMAIPALVLLRYRYPHQWFYRSALIPFDSAPQDSHRRLRVRLKFSRQRWQAVK